MPTQEEAKLDTILTDLAENIAEEEDLPLSREVKRDSISHDVEVRRDGDVILIDEGVSPTDISKVLRRGILDAARTDHGYRTQGDLERALKRRIDGLDQQLASLYRLCKEGNFDKAQEKNERIGRTIEEIRIARRRLDR